MTKGTAAPSSAAGHRDRLRQRFADNPSQLTDDQRLELLLTFAIPRRDVAPLASSLIRRFGSLEAVFSADADSLKRVEGVGDTSAALIQLVATLRASSKPPALPSSANGKAHTPSAARRASDAPLFDAPKPTIAQPGKPVATGSTQLPPPSPAPPAATVVTEPVKPASRRPAAATPKKQMPKRQRTGLFSGGVYSDAAKLVSRIPLGTDPDGARKFLEREGLHYSSATTRNRYASYIVVRLFPAKQVDDALLKFARAYENSQAVRDAVLYRFMIAETVLAGAVTDLLVPSVGRQPLPRTHLRRYLSQRFPDAKQKTVDTCAKAIVEALDGAGFVTATRLTLTAHYRPIDLRSFAFVLHNEFPEPGIHKLEAVENSPAVRGMLWPAEEIKTALYELRNLGLITKVSEIDSVRQFTTKLTLEGAVDALIAKGVKP